MIRTLSGGLLGGLALYLVGFLFWGTPLSAIAYHRADAQGSANLQAAMAQALTPTGTGVYIIPDPATAQGTILYGKGPVALLHYNSSGFPVTDSASLIGGLILALVVGVLIALLLRSVSGGFAGRARVVAMLSLVAVLWLHIGQAVFNHTPWGYSLYLAISDFAGLLAAGLVAAKLMEGRATSQEASDAPSMH